MKGEAGAAEEDEANEAAGAVEAVGTAGERSNLTVEALRRSVAQAGGDEGEDAIEVPPNRPRELLERREARARRPAAPRDELLSRDADLSPAEDLSEGFLEQVGAVQGPVRALDLGELVALDGGEVPGILEQRPAVFFSGTASGDPANERTCSRRTWSTASCARRCTWKRSKTI
jgi:hypothetical protein